MLAGAAWGVRLGSCLQGPVGHGLGVEGYEEGTTEVHALSSGVLGRNRWHLPEGEHLTLKDPLPASVPPCSFPLSAPRWLSVVRSAEF